MHGLYYMTPPPISIERTQVSFGFEIYANILEHKQWPSNVRLFRFKGCNLIMFVKKLICCVVSYSACEYLGREIESVVGIHRVVVLKMMNINIILFASKNKLVYA
jgi:hypothetical protein